MQILKTLSEKCVICTGFGQISHPLFYINLGLHVSSKSLLWSYNDQDHPWAAKISKQYLLHTKLENLLFWWGWKMATTTSP
jgi:hypothetical protein